MGVTVLRNSESFSDKYKTYIIAYCPDGDFFFISNERHFYWEYHKEFNTENEAIDFFMNNREFFFDCRLNLMNFIEHGDIERLRLQRISGMETSWERPKRYTQQFFYDVIDYALSEGTGIEYEDGDNFTTDCEVAESKVLGKKIRYVSWTTMRWFLSEDIINRTRYVINLRRLGKIEETRLLALDEWIAICNHFECPEMSFEDAMVISNTLYKYDIEALGLD